MIPPDPHSFIKRAHLLLKPQFGSSNQKGRTLTFRPHIRIGHPGIKAVKEKIIFDTFIILKPRPAIHHHQKDVTKGKKNRSCPEDSKKEVPLLISTTQAGIVEPGFENKNDKRKV